MWSANMALLSFIHDHVHYAVHWS